MSRNLGSTSLRRKRRNQNSMQTFDSLPEPLRLWLHDAALPWSPASAKKVWSKALARGLSPEDALATLTRAEKRMLERDKHGQMVEA
ncbi:MAG: DUF6525 family protein [Pseudomonadota bacterium]